MPMRLAVLAVAVSLAGCNRTPQRPPTAMEYCKQLGERYFEAKTECSTITDSKVLTALHALEAANLMKRIPDPAVPGTDKLVDLAWVAYQDKIDRESVGGLMKLLGQELLSTARLSAINEEARVSVYVVRGEITAEKFEKLQAEVAKLAPRAAQ